MGCAQAQCVGGKCCSGIADGREQDLAKSKHMALRSTRADRQFIDFTEFHFAGVLINSRKDLRQERGESFTIQLLRQEVSHEKALLHCHHCTVDTR